MRFSLWSVLAIALTSKCKQEPKPPFKIVIHVEADPGIPSPKVPIFFGDVKVKETDDAGNAALDIARPDGESVTLDVKCPVDTTVAAPILVVIRRTDNGKPVEYKAQCKPLTRSLVVAVRAEAGPAGNTANLPVMYLGKVVARTDAAGAAHFGLRLRMGESFQVSLDTSANERLKPRDPSTSFVVESDDEVKIFNAKFTEDKKKIYIAPKKIGPKPF